MSSKTRGLSPIDLSVAEMEDTPISVLLTVNKQTTKYNTFLSLCLWTFCVILQAWESCRGIQHKEKHLALPMYNIQKVMHPQGYKQMHRKTTLTKGPLDLMMKTTQTQTRVLTECWNTSCPIKKKKIHLNFLPLVCKLQRFQGYIWVSGAFGPCWSHLQRKCWTEFTLFPPANHL